MPLAPPFAFASSHALDESTLLEAPLRWPRPSRLSELLPGATDLGPKAAKALETLGLHTIGDLLEHLPRARGEARTLATLVPGETATVVVEVSKIASHPVRRRGMKPRV